MPLSLSGYVNWSQIWESCRQVSRLQQLRGLGSCPLPQPSWASSALRWLVKVSNHTPQFQWLNTKGRGVSSVWGEDTESLSCDSVLSTREPPLAYVVTLSQSTLPCRLYKLLKSQSLALRGVTSEKTNNTCERRWKGEAATTCVKNLCVLHFHSSCWLHL